MNRLIKYGDGVFETILVHRNGWAPLGTYHYARLMSSLNTLGIKCDAISEQEAFENAITEAAGTIDADYVRVRLVVYRDAEGAYAPDSDQGAIGVEALAYHPAQRKQLLASVPIFQEARLAADAYSALKTCSALRYVMAGRFIRDNQLDECFMLNTEGRIAEASYSNLFVVTSGKIYTPPLSEGCVAGIMRQWLMAQEDLAVEEKPISVVDVSDADEIFLTNALQGIRIVGIKNNISPVGLRLQARVDALLYDTSF